MKRAYRERALSRLYAELQSDDFDAREYALFQLALMLKRANDGTRAEDFAAGEQLPRDLRRIFLSPADQKQIVARLMKLMSRTAESRATAFWALGEVAAEFAFIPASAAIGEHGDQFSDEAALQACRALQTWLDSEDINKSLLDALLANEGACRSLRRWSRSADARLAKRAKAVISRARALST